MSCYLSYQNNQQVPLDADGGYGDYPPFIWQGEIFCSVVGVFWGLGGGSPPNNCDFTIAPAAVTGAYCNGTQNATAYTATIKPSASDCSYNYSLSSCSWTVVSGDIDYVSNTPNLQYESCTANYFAGPAGAPPPTGTETGTIQFQMTLQLGQAAITHTQTAAVYCK